MFANITLISTVLTGFVGNLFNTKDVIMKKKKKDWSPGRPVLQKAAPPP